jgi:TonB family protein
MQRFQILHPTFMKIFICIAFLLFFQDIKAQKIGDTVISYIDTINVYGKVIDIKGQPVKDALIFCGFEKSTKTDKHGRFEINGIKPIENFIVTSSKGKIYFKNNSSRYLLIKIEPPKVILSSDQVQISHKKITEKPKIKNVGIIKIIAFDSVDGVEKLAEYPGGLNKFYAFLNNNINYPKNAIKNNIEGNVKIEFTINQKGNSEQYIIINDLGYGCAQEIIKALKKMKQWLPTVENGNAKNQIYTLTVPFKLID